MRINDTVVSAGQLQSSPVEECSTCILLAGGFFNNGLTRVQAALYPDNAPSLARRLTTPRGVPETENEEGQCRHAGRGPTRSCTFAQCPLSNVATRSRAWPYIAFWVASCSPFKVSGPYHSHRFEASLHDLPRVQLPTPHCHAWWECPRHEQSVLLIGDMLMFLFSNRLLAPVRRRLFY